MTLIKRNIEIISAPSVLGLRPTGVEGLSESFLAAGLATNLQVRYPLRNIPTLNALYTDQRDRETNCLNPQAIKRFSLDLKEAVTNTLNEGHLPIILGGDCSILIGIMPALKAKGSYGLFFLDAHADFYEPEKSITGEVADMDLAIVTGRGPSLLTDIDTLKPYVKDEHVIYIGQRDEEETKKYGSRDIRKTAIKCFSLAEIKKRGMDETLTTAIKYAQGVRAEGFWIHFDTDVLSDDINPAVDYRLPDGLLFSEIEQILRSLLTQLNIIGMSVTIFNPRLDPDGSIALAITNSISAAFTSTVS